MQSENHQSQIWTYLNWLHERGQVFVRADASDAEGEGDKALAPSAEMKPIRWLLNFISPKPLSADEKTMVTRIAAALGYAEYSYAISERWIAGAQEHAVFLGCQPPPESVGCLIISHPEAMIRDPSLKREAWDILQKIRRF